MNFENRLTNLLAEVEGSTIPEGNIGTPDSKAWFRMKIEFVLSDPEFLTEEIISGYEMKWANITGNKTNTADVPSTQASSVSAEESLRVKEIVEMVRAKHAGYVTDLNTHHILLDILALEDVTKTEIEEALDLFEFGPVKTQLREELLGEYSRLYQVLYCKRKLNLPIDGYDLSPDAPRLSEIRFWYLISNAATYALNDKEVAHLMTLTKNEAILLIKEDIISTVFSNA